jgi:hypothetical protein
VLPIVIPTAVLAWFCIAGVYRKLGHAGAALDDAYIHYQYARAFAELHPFRYQAGEPFTTGATSLLWPAVLAPFYAMGFRDTAIVWPAWALSFVALGLLAHEARELTRPLAGRAAGIGAAAMVLAFSAFSWCAASGMEVVPFAWVLARAARKGSEWVEAGRNPPADARPRRVELLILAGIAPLLRPEGALASWTIAAALLAAPMSRPRQTRLTSLAAFAAPLLPFALAYALTGQFRSATAVAKLLLGNPYYAGAALRAAIGQNIRVLVGTLLNGEVWSAEFIPKGGNLVACAGALAILLRGWESGRGWRAATVLVLALGIAIPCTYVSFLWNRLRYLWPFATGWLVGLACLARVLGDALSHIGSRWRVATPIACGAFVGILGMRQSWAMDDLADSTSGIDRQHVALGRWAKDQLPKNARIGVNDTGAIAYFSDHTTFDIVGLTTRDEARYWVAGPASRFEHYERLHAHTPDLLPTHFIVYPEWMACDAVLGPTLYGVTVLDATILGGTTMRVYEADYSLLGSGEGSWTLAGSPVDTLDVADLESEASHGYDLEDARDGEEIVRTGVDPEGREVADGGRNGRRVERFRVSLQGKAARAIVRLEASVATTVRAGPHGGSMTQLAVGDGPWGEYEFNIPATGTSEPLDIELDATAPVTVYHYWFFIAP